MIIHIKWIGYINPKQVRWVSPINTQINMGLPIKSFAFRLEGVTSDFNTTSHTVQVNNGIQTWTPTGATPEDIDQAHMGLLTAWENAGE